MGHSWRHVKPEILLIHDWHNWGPGPKQPLHSGWQVFGQLSPLFIIIIESLVNLFQSTNSEKHKPVEFSSILLLYLIDTS